MSKDRSWMYNCHDKAKFVEGVFEFCERAEAYSQTQKTGGFYCPCFKCANDRKFESIAEVRLHLLLHGFRPDYYVWSYQGETGVHDGPSSRGNHQHDDSSHQHNKDYTHATNDDVYRNDDYERDEADHRVEEMVEGLDNGRGFESISEASRKPLYPGCTKLTILVAVMELFSVKSENNWTDRSFTMLLEKLSGMFPDGNELPKSTYYAKKLMCPFGLEYERIHACPNDCILYRKDYELLDKCPKCNLPRYDRQGARGKAGPPSKVLWYLPIIPRFKRLFSITKDAKNLRWHAEGRRVKGLLQHPADGPEWKTINRKYKTFGDDNRNLRLGLCTDGMNPFGTLSSKHSSWPVILTIYNLPPWLCMKRKYLMLSLLISGPKQPGNDIDVYLEPLVDDLRKLWDEGVLVYDSHAKETFTLRAMLLCTVNDFPAYGNLSGYKNKGMKACPICMDDGDSTWVGKYVDWCHRRFLPPNHPFRKKKKPFNGMVEDRVARRPLTGYEVYSQVKGVQTIFGKPNVNYSGLWKKESIFWQLPYWRDLQVRHCLDVMHIEKNVCDAILATLFNIPNKTKDTKGNREFLKQLGVRPELWPQLKESKKRKNQEEDVPSQKGKGKEKVQQSSNEEKKTYYLPPACYTMSKQEKIHFCTSLYNLKVPSGYSSNMRRFVTLDGELMLSSMKSHDCHVMMQVFLPIAIRGILPKHVRYTITELCSFFNTICSKALDPTTLDTLQARVVETLCKFEMYFPPAFFDIMVHLIVHLVREIKLLGPVFLRWCYPYERHMGVLGNKVANPARPESSIVQGVISDEVGNFIAEYVAGAHPIGLPKTRHEWRLDGKGTIGSRTSLANLTVLNQAHLYVLHHMAEVHPFLTEHWQILKTQNPGISERALSNLHNKTFIEWFHNRVVVDNLQGVTEIVKWLAYGPRETITNYEGYDINGYSFWTTYQDQKSPCVQNSGVSLLASSTFYASAKDQTPIDATVMYYGQIAEMWELEYCTFNVCLFKCKWVDNNRRSVKNDDPCGFTLVDMTRMREGPEPFILAGQAKQVFYVTDPADSKWSIVLPGKRSILGIGDVDDEEEYDAFEDSSPFMCPKTSVAESVANESSYLREDHAEGITVAEN